eukprot:1780394-Rhodomonas_salina.1
MLAPKSTCSNFEVPGYPGTRVHGTLVTKVSAQTISHRIRLYAPTRVVSLLRRRICWPARATRRRTWTVGTPSLRIGHTRVPRTREPGYRVPSYTVQRVPGTQYPNRKMTKSSRMAARRNAPGGTFAVQVHHGQINRYSRVSLENHVTLLTGTGFAYPGTRVPGYPGTTRVPVPQGQSISRETSLIAAGRSQRVQPNISAI